MPFQLRKDRGLLDGSRVTALGIDEVRPNPSQPRRVFDQEALDELAESIRLYGVLQPISVRKSDAGYELIAGERRLRAARMAGLRQIPAIVLDVDERQSALFALIENLQRRDLDFIEEAEGLYKLIRTFGLSQEEAARLVGKSQPAVANKLRLLRHPPELIELIRKSGLTERHARALLRLPEGSVREKAARHIIERGFNVEQSEEYIEKLVTVKPEPEAKQPKLRTLYLIKDVRFFLNTVNRAVDIMKQSGVDADCNRDETDREIVLTIKIPKRVSNVN